MDWAIYYGDRTRFTDEDGHPDEAPTTNVAVIAQADPECGRVLVARRDYYCFHDGEWYGHDLIGLIDYLQRAGILKLGRTLPNAVYAEILAAAASSPELPRKSARRRGEPTGP